MSSALRTAAVLVHKSSGTALCPECNALNLVRDSKLQCHCKFIADIIYCACGCGLKLLNIDKRGRSPLFIPGHNAKSMAGPKSPNWKGGRKKSGGMFRYHLTQKGRRMLGRIDGRGMVD